MNIQEIISLGIIVALLSICIATLFALMQLLITLHVVIPELVSALRLYLITKAACERCDRGMGVQE